MKRKSIIPVLVAARILSNAGAIRISKEAAEEFAELIESKGRNIGKYAVELAKHAKRNTVMREDIKIASRKGP